jgi:transposase InsO family protein/transposase
MSKQRVYYRATTTQQRQLLFETWETTGCVTQACEKARVSRGTFYNWKERFDQAGYAGLVHPGNHAPHQPAQKPAELAAQVVALRRQHPDWGKQRIADETAKAHSWELVIYPNTVRRMLRDAGLWATPTPPAPPDPPAVRTAELPGQTLNVDLCFVPATHEAAQKLPAVSGSSGRLVVASPAEAADERHWPGQVFANDSLEYVEAMAQFVAVSQTPSPTPPNAVGDDQVSLKARKRALRQEEARLRADRRAVRQQRQQEDGAWQARRAERSQPPTPLLAPPPAVAPPELAPSPAPAAEVAPPARPAPEEQGRALRQHRRETLAQRRAEDQAWREQCASFRERWALLPLVTAWIAILVVTDNCTRQCLGLPVFVMGSHVTAELIVEALRALLPPELQFLISDRGTHFTAKVFQAFAHQEGFIHVLIARHRPQSNGIAERFVRTFKEWLRDKSWQDDQELAALAVQFLAEYNDRPHQGLPIPGLSPNEFTQRIWLM